MPPIVLVPGCADDERDDGWKGLTQSYDDVPEPTDLFAQLVEHRPLVNFSSAMRDRCSATAASPCCSAQPSARVWGSSRQGVRLARASGKCWRNSTAGWGSATSLLIAGWTTRNCLPLRPGAQAARRTSPLVRVVGVVPEERVVHRLGAAAQERREAAAVDVLLRMRLSRPESVRDYLVVVARLGADLGSADERRVWEHLAGCAACRARRATSAVRSALPSLTTKTCSNSPELASAATSPLRSGQQTRSVAVFCTMPPFSRW